MAVSIEELRGFTQQLGFSFKEIEIDGVPTLAISVPTETSQGDQEFTILAKSYDNGEMFEAMMLKFIPTELHQKSEYKAQFLFYLLHKAWQTKFGTPEVDKDGEVRLLVEIPLVDAVMTLKQFEHILRVTTKTAFAIALEGRQILMHGELPDSASEDVGDQLRQTVEMMIQMLGTAKGRAKLEEIAADEETPEVLREMANKLLAAGSQAPDSL